MGTTFLEALPSAAQSPLAMVGYLAAIGATVAIAFRVRRNKNLLQKIQAIPKGDRKEALQNEMNVVLPREITAEQWLRSRLHQYYFIGSLVVILSLTLIGVIALTEIGGGDKGRPPAGAGSGNEVLANSGDPAGESANEAMPTNEVAPAPTPVGAATFSPVMLEDRTIDLCIAPSDQYQALEQQCSGGATRLIADEFCRRKGHLGSASFKGENTGIFQTSYKLSHTMDENGNVQNVFEPFDQGGAIFTSITCR